MDSDTAVAIIQTIPRQWDVSNDTRQAWAELICRRAHIVAENVERWSERAVPQFRTGGE
jgi:hypothetical protein